MSGENSQPRWPWGVPDKQSLTATGAQALTIVNDKTHIDGVSVVATGNRTLDLTIDSGVNEGAIIVLKTKTTGTETTIMGTNITGVTFAGVAGKTKVTTFELVDGVFVNTATPVQID
jgi:hypothetical protein